MLNRIDSSARETLISHPQRLIEQRDHRDGTLATIRAALPVTIAAVMIVLSPNWAHADGEPAESFLKQLRAAGLHDQAITYLDRLDRYPGVDAELLSAVALEKAQTHIDSIITARTASQRDQAFDAAMEQLQVFLKKKNHPRASEAQTQLGKLQMVRGAQLLASDQDDAEKAARQSFLDAAKTFDSIIETLRGKLSSMQGARIDPKNEPEKAALRDQYRFEFLQAQVNAGEARLSAAETFPNPQKNAKNLLTEALERYTDLSEKYEKYVQGASAFFPRGRVEQMLGQKEKAVESFTRMLEQPDADDLRPAKIGATIRLMEMELAKKPPKFNEALKLGEEFTTTVRPNERSLPAVQDLRLVMAKAHLANRDAKSTKPPQKKRATAEARKLLLEAKKYPGDHIKDTEALLADMGISASDEADVQLPSATDDPESFDAALASARELWTGSESLQKQVTALEKANAAKDEIQRVEQSLTEIRGDAITLLRRGLSMIDGETRTETANEARQLLTYLLFSQDQLWESHVVGSFLARTSPGTDAGLRGGLLSLSSLQKLIGDEAVDRLMPELESLGNYLATTWPEDPKAAMAKGILIRLALSQDQFDKAATMIDEMPTGAEKNSFLRIQGQLKYQQARQSDDDQATETLMNQAISDLSSGFENLTLVAPADLQAALVLAKAHLAVDQPGAAVRVLDHPKFGPVKQSKNIDTPSEGFMPELYRTQLQALVGQMTNAEGDTDKLVRRASKAMDDLRASASGPDGKRRLLAIFLSLATDIREQLDNANPQRKSQLIKAFRVFLERIADSTKDPATLMWVGQTMMEMGESSMPPGTNVAAGEAKDLLTMASETFEKLKDYPEAPKTTPFLYGKTLRLSGGYSKALDEFEDLLRAKPTMLDAQIEAARTYEQWAATLPAKFKGNAYKAALMGGRPGNDKKNVIWGWGKISQVTQRSPQFRDAFFDARYHIALCRFLQGKAI
ncbi:MAG: hypothetical protein AAF745_05170, partial [Planctomycetota bacterium]